MTLRVTEGSAIHASLVGLQAKAGRLAQLQDQLSSGRQITRPSDSPTGTSTALRLRAELSRISQYQGNASDGIGWLQTTDTTMSSITAQLQNARTLIVQGMNTGTGNATSNGAIAAQIDQLRSSVLSLANTSYLGRPVFGGTTAGKQAYDAAANFVGDTNAVSRAIAPGTTVDINVSGTSVFGAPGNSVFDVLANASNALRTNPAALGAQLDALDAAMGQISSQQAVVGATYNRVQSAQADMAAGAIDRKSQLSQVQDIDLADMAIQVSSADAAYQAALQTTAKIRQTSLLDFVR